MRDAGTVLLLGGTSEASQLGSRLADAGVDAVTSFAGRTSRPAPPAGRMRIGGFGGPEGLARYLVDEAIGRVVDATHPFAAVMPHNAAAACAEVGVPRLRLLRDEWSPTAGDDWRVVPSVTAAADWVRAQRPGRVFLTIGRQEADAFAGIDGVTFVVRSLEPADLRGFAHAIEVLARGPFSVDDERRLFDEHRVDAVVSKNSGGDATVAKLTVARERGLPVVMVARPRQPDGPCTNSVAAAYDWVLAAL